MGRLTTAPFVFILLYSIMETNPRSQVHTSQYDGAFAVLDLRPERPKGQIEVCKCGRRRDAERIACLLELNIRGD